jgi:uncharacterized protein
LAVALSHMAAAWYFCRAAAPAQQKRIKTALAVSLTLLAWGFTLLSHRAASYYPPVLASWGRAASLGWAGLSLAFLAGLWIVRRFPVRAEHHAARRAFLRTAQIAVFGSPVATLGYGVLQRQELRMREVAIEIPDLHKDLDGLRLVQLTDIHLGPFLNTRVLERAVDMANQMRADIALITGDLISVASDPLDDCIRILARLRATAGIFGCMGNHEIYAEAETYVAEQGAKRGMHFLRQQSSTLRFGQAKLNLAGVDYQPMGSDYLEGTESLLVPDAFNVLLSHNPDVFPVAARKGFPLTVSGHTHGGQVRMEILRQDLNIARFFTPYVDGVYKEGGSAVFVSRGIGTIGMPARLGAPPEVALIRLCRA